MSALEATPLTGGPARALIRGRMAMIQMYTDRCHVTREAQPGDEEYVPDGQRTMDPVTMQYPPQNRITVYRGPCRMQVKADINSNVVETTAGDKEFTYLTSQLQVPSEVSDLQWFADTTGFEGDPTLIDVDHIAEIESSPHDSAMAGRLFNIAGPYHKSQAVYRRFRVREAV